MSTQENDRLFEQIEDNAESIILQELEGMDSAELAGLPWEEGFEAALAELVRCYHRSKFWPHLAEKVFNARQEGDFK